MSYENNVLTQLSKLQSKFHDKICLDIGTRDGLNCISLVKLGAKKVIGIDIDSSSFYKMPLNDKVELIKTDLLDYNNEDKFDIITCFLWNISFLERNKVVDKIKELLKPNGFVLIGIHDDVYKYDKYVSVVDLIKNNFSDTWILDKNDSFQWIIMAQGFKN
jgi:SAM-dependent methyltransferase